MQGLSVLSAVAGPEAVVLNGKLDNRIAFLGSSVPSNLEPSISWVPFISLAPQEGQEGVMAIKVEEKGKRQGEYSTFYWLLSVSWKDDKPYVHLEQPWVPPADRMPRIVQEGYIEINIEGVCFSTDERVQDRPGKRYVDGNTLCQYLAGDIDVDVLKAAASEFTEKHSLEEMLREQLAQQDRAIENLSVERLKLAERASGYQYTLARLHEAYLTPRWHWLKRRRKIREQVREVTSRSF